MKQCYSRPDAVCQGLHSETGQSRHWMDFGAVESPMPSMEFESVAEHYRINEDRQHVHCAGRHGVGQLNLLRAKKQTRHPVSHIDILLQ